MKWTPGGGLGRNVEDRRGGGMRGMAPMGIGGAILMLVLGLIFGPDVMTDGGQQVESAGEVVAPPANESASERQLAEFVSFVLDDAQGMWTQAMPGYREATLVLFRGATQTGCGMGEAGMGPFYCPADQKVYIDLGFYDQLRTRFGAEGDFAQAYVIAHEIGHHVQTLMGTSEEVRRTQQRSPGSANQLSVAMELQADCYAGVWGHSAAQRGKLEPGDIEEGLGAAAAVGDDRIQGATRGTVNQESFTHGSAEQRASWFRRGLETGDPRACDTFR